MKGLTAARVCIAVLYGVDALVFNGGYFATLNRVIFQIYIHW